MRWERAAEEQNAKDVPVNITTMAHDDEPSAGQMNFTQNSNEALLRHSISGRKVRRRALAGGTQSDRKTSMAQCERDNDYGSQG